MVTSNSVVNSSGTTAVEKRMMEMLEKMVNHWSTLTIEDLIPVAFLSLLIIWIIASNRHAANYEAKLDAIAR